MDSEAPGAGSMSGGPSVNMSMALGGYNEYYRQDGRCYKRNRHTGETTETSFEELLRSHQIARELIDDQRGDFGSRCE